MDYSKLTLGELLSHQDQTIRRNAISILKQFQKKQGAIHVHDWHPAYNGTEEVKMCYGCDATMDNSGEITPPVMPPRYWTICPECGSPINEYYSACSNPKCDYTQ